MMELNDVKDPALVFAGLVVSKMFRLFEKKDEKSLAEVTALRSEVGTARERIGQLEMQNKAAFREIDLLREELKDLRHSR